MTREELKQHCLKQVAYYEEMMKLKSEYVMLPSNHSKIYQEHKLILELLEESEKKAYRKIESIPYLMHKELDVPISECQKAYDVAIDYLRSQGKIKG